MFWITADNSQPTTPQNNLAGSAALFNTGLNFHFF